MKSLFEEMGGTYRQVGDYFIPNLVLPEDGNYQIGKYGRMRRSYLKEHRKILYTNYVTVSVKYNIDLRKKAADEIMASVEYRTVYGSSGKYTRESETV